MIEFTWTEVALLVWAVIATVLAMEFWKRNLMGNFFITKLLEDKEMYAHYKARLQDMKDKRGMRA